MKQVMLSWPAALIAACFGLGLASCAAFWGYVQTSSYQKSMEGYSARMVAELKKEIDTLAASLRNEAATVRKDIEGLRDGYARSERDRKAIKEEVKAIKEEVKSEPW